LLALLAFTVSLSSSIAWKVSDVDFATKLGSDRLAQAYVFTALAIFGSSALILSGLKSLSPQAIFLSVQRYAGLSFGALAVLEILFSLSHYTSMIFFFKVLGYAYSALVINAFWIALYPYDEKSPVTAGQYTLYTFCTYFGMSAAGVWLQSDTIGARHLGLLVTGCSIVCWLLGTMALEGRKPLVLKRSIPLQVDQTHRPSPSQTLFRAMLGSRAVMTLVLGSILLNVLVSSTEYYFIADFESRFLTLQNAPSGVNSIGSFVTLIGFGNILTLFTSRLWSKFQLGRAGLPVATIFAVLMMRIGFTDSQSLISSVVTLLVVESVYPLVVESNMQYLLARFPESERLSARTMIDAIAEPAGLILSAMLLIMPGFDIHTLGIGVVCIAILLLLISCYADAVWRRSQVASFRQMISLVAARCSTYLVLCQTLLPCVDRPYELAEDLIVVEGYNWLYIPAVQWCD
jgi:hypothetical protein